MSNGTLGSDKVSTSGSRRGFLKLVGGGAILALGAGSLFVMTRTPSKALEPWKLALGPSVEIDPRRVVLSHAILSPNPHNRQPWLVDLVGDDEIVLYCDLDRRLPETDPYDRQITIGLGCFLELARLTALEIGMKMHMDLFPDGEAFPRLDSRPVARLRLEDTSTDKDPLFAQLFDRRSNKEPFDTMKPVSPNQAEDILSSAEAGAQVGYVLDETQISTLRDITWSALDVEMRTYRTAKESIDLMRIGKQEIEANPDGIDLGGAFMEILSATGQLSRESLLAFDETMFEQSQASIRPPLDTAMGYVYVKSEGNSRIDQINAGRTYVRLNLKATELGVSMHPLSQALQEFPEVAAQNKRIKEELGVKDDETLQMLARIGFGDTPQPSPRWGYDTRIRSS
ncbi:MAG: twin-arginine translocation pathway signal protein [Pseudomonadota bacterium]